MTETADPFETRARDLLRDTPLIDGHNDLAYALRGRVGLRTSEVDLRRPVPGLDTDIPRLRAGVVGGQFWSVWVPADLPEPEAVLQSLKSQLLCEIVGGAFGGASYRYRLTEAGRVRAAAAFERIR